MTEQAQDKGEWGFDKIRPILPERASQLESCRPPDDLINEISSSLVDAVDTHHIRFAVDSIGNEFQENRITVQFQVIQHLYDWFFNSRTGYRAQYWRSPGAGNQFNSRIIHVSSLVLQDKLPDTGIEARRIHVEVLDGIRDERDIGSITLSRDQILHSLVPELSKIWIGEWLYSATGRIDNIGFAVLSDAERSAAKLDIPRWADARCHTPQDQRTRRRSASAIP